jgi:arylformamidase
VADIDYEVEYNNRVRVPENPALMSGWARDAAAYRAAHAPRQIAYGSGIRNTIDLFSGDEQGGPIVVFIHGGYWQALDGSSFSHCARGLNAHGIDVAVPSYDLCPQVTVDTIIAQMRAAARELAMLGRPLVISGHSAGGHLAACLLATDWSARDASLKGLVVAAYAISGLFDLVPLVGTSINKALGLDEAAAKSSSPLFWKAPSHGSLDAVVGEKESAEYHRQSRTMTQAWAKAGLAARYGIIADANHFTAIAPLADAASPMVMRLKQLARR